MVKISAIVILFLICVLRLPAQFIPGERIPKPGEEQALLQQLKNSEGGIHKIESLLQLSAYYVYEPGEEKEDLQKALKYNHYAKELSTAHSYQDGYNECITLAADIYGELGEAQQASLMLDTAQQLLQQQLGLLPTIKDPARHIRAFRQMADIYRAKSKFQEAEQMFLKIIPIYQQQGWPGVHFTYLRLSMLNLLRGEYSNALNFAIQSMKLSEQGADSSALAQVYPLLGLVYRNIGQFQKSVDNYKKAIAYYQNRSAPAVFDYTERMSSSLLKLKRYDEAVELLLRTRKQFPTRNYFQTTSMERALGTAYMAMKNYDLAEKHFLHLLRLKQQQAAEGPGDYKLLGQLYVEARRYHLAKPYLEKALEAQSAHYPPAWLAHLHFLLFKTDSAAGNHLAAISHLMKNKQLDDVVYEQTKARENQELQIKYETEKKDQELLVGQKNIELLTKEKLLQQARLTQATNSRNLIIAGSAILLLLLLITYRRYQEKQKTTTVINNKNLALQHLITEKEWLLKEVHHRVKNNLQIVVSLLESQSAYLRDDALLAMQDSQNRVFAMSLIHQKLYQANNVTSISMQQYLPELVQYLREIFNVKNMQFNWQVGPVDLDVSQAIPVGLIVNEAITNTIKYAFPQQDNKEVLILLQQQANGQVTLRIADNGIGIPHHLTNGQTGSLGLKLMKGLSEDLNGTCSIQSINGTEITITFAVNEPLNHLFRSQGQET